jgi:hypothetical protein
MLIEKHEFTWKGQPVTISISDDYLHKVSFHNRGMIEELVVKDLQPNFITQEVICTYVTNRLNTYDFSVESSTMGVFTTTKEEFKKFYYTATGNVPIGIVLGRELTNGMSFEHRDFGVRFFDAYLMPRQPVTFEAVSTPSATKVEKMAVAERGGSSTTGNQPMMGGTNGTSGTAVITYQDSVVDTYQGSIEVNVVDGIAPFKYSINLGAQQDSNVFVNLAAGTYSVRVEDSKGTYKIENVVVDGSSSL